MSPLISTCQLDSKCGIKDEKNPLGFRHSGEHFPSHTNHEITMAQQSLFSACHRTDDIKSFTISPAKELGAYESLWAREKMSFKKMADLFRDNPGTLPSDLVKKDEAISMSNTVVGMLKKSGIGHYGVRIHRAGEYPEKIRVAQNPIEFLYFQGIWDLVEKRSVAIVGSRNASPDGIKRTQKLVRHLLEDDFAIVSGLAQGIDTAAHTAAIKEGGDTISVIGTPITDYYPRNNEKLQKEIADKHLLISQVPVYKYSTQDYRYNRNFFPERNKTMSALTEATIIVEAGETSGTLIQARAALYQKRKLFILDSCFKNKKITWPEKFEKKGAIRVRSYDDIKNILLKK